MRAVLASVAISIAICATAGGTRAAKPAAPTRPSAAGYRFLGEGSAFTAWEKGGRVWKVLKFKNRYTDETTPHDPRRAMVVHEQVSGHALLKAHATFARRWGHVVIPSPSPTRRAGVTVSTLVDEGVAWKQLTPKAKARARRQIEAITDDAMTALEGGFVTDVARSNFRFTPRGKIVAWFDPIHTTAFRFTPRFGPGGAVDLVLGRFADASDRAPSDAEVVGHLRATATRPLELLPGYR